MKKTVILIILIISSLLGDSKNIDITIKAKQNNEFIHIGIGIKNNINKIESIKDNSSMTFISRMIVKVDDEIVNDISSSSNFYAFPIRIQYKEKKTKEHVQITAIDNSGKTYKITKTIPSTINDKFETKTIETTSRTIINQDIWKIKSEKRIIKKLFNGTNQNKGNLYLCTPDITGIGQLVNIKLKSDDIMKSIAILGTGNKYPLLARINNPNNKKIDYSFGILMQQQGDIIILGEATDGNIYKVKHNVIISNSGDSQVNCSY